MAGRALEPTGAGGAVWLAGWLDKGGREEKGTLGWIQMHCLVAVPAQTNSLETQRIREGRKTTLPAFIYTTYISCQAMRKVLYVYKRI